MAYCKLATLEHYGDQTLDEPTAT